MKIAFCDLETTGLSREKHEIIEIAGVIWDNVEDLIVDTFHEYIKPNGNIPPIITQITGITNYTVMNARKSWDVLPDFYSWLKVNGIKIIAGHNFKSFDSKFLEAQVIRYKLNERFAIDLSQYESIDTLTIARALNKAGKITTPDCKQTTLAEYFNIKYNAHSAIEDVKALVNVYRMMRKLDSKLI